MTAARVHLCCCWLLLRHPVRLFIQQDYQMIKPIRFGGSRLFESKFDLLCLSIAKYIIAELLLLLLEEEWEADTPTEQQQTTEGSTTEIKKDKNLFCVEERAMDIFFICGTFPKTVSLLDPNHLLLFYITVLACLPLICPQVAISKVVDEIQISKRGMMEHIPWLINSRMTL